MISTRWTCPVDLNGSCERNVLGRVDLTRCLIMSSFFRECYNIFECNDDDLFTCSSTPKGDLLLLSYAFLYFCLHNVEVCVQYYTVLCCRAQQFYDLARERTV